jgi:hypothetical protein
VLPDGRADTLAINALLPLLTAPRAPLADVWMDWPPGNHPEDVREARQHLGLEGPARNWEVQGILDVIRRTNAGAPTPD